MRGARGWLTFTSYWVYIPGPIAGAVIAVGIAFVLRGRGGGAQGELLTEVRTRGQDRWTLGFEATGAADLLHSELQATAALVRPAPARRRGTRPGLLQVLRGVARPAAGCGSDAGT